MVGWRLAAAPPAAAADCNTPSLLGLPCPQINAEKSPYLTDKLKVWMLPTLALVKHEKARGGGGLKGGQGRTGRASPGDASLGGLHSRLCGAQRRRPTRGGCSRWALGMRPRLLKAPRLPHSAAQSPSPPTHTLLSPLPLCAGGRLPSGL